MPSIASVPWQTEEEYFINTSHEAEYNECNSSFNLEFLIQGNCEAHRDLCDNKPALGVKSMLKLDKTFKGTYRFFMQYLDNVLRIPNPASC